MDNQIKDLIQLNGGLNFDDEARVIPNGDYRYAMCCRNYDKIRGNLGAIVNVSGNTLIEFQLPFGNNTVIGSCPYVEEKSIVYFVYNDRRNHCILQYRTVENTIQPILFEEPLLGFNLTHRIYHANIVENLLLWTDDLNHPRKINIKRAIEYTAGTGGYTSLDAQVINAIKYPPQAPPQTIYGTTGYFQGVPNNLKGRSWQFAYSYIYDDFEYSRLSEFSTVITDRYRYSVSDQKTIPNNLDANFMVIHEAPDYYNNKIEVKVKTGHHTVVKILFFVRNIQNNTFLRIGEVSKYDQDGNQVIADNTDYIFDFMNDGTYTPISIQESNLFSDGGPVRAFAQEVVDKNILVYGNTVMNYPKPTIDINITTAKLADPSGGYLYNQLPGGNNPNFELDLLFNEEFNSTGSPTIYSGITSQDITIPDGFKATHFRARWPSTNGAITLFDGLDLIRQFVTRNQHRNRTPSTYPYSAFRDIGDYIVSNATAQETYFIVTENNFVNFIIVSAGVTPYFYSLKETQGANNQTPKLSEPNFEYGLKRGTRKQFGIVYKDFAKRNPGVVFDSKMLVEVPFFNSDFTDQFAALAQFEINNVPPKWAHYFQFAISSSSFIQFSQAYVKGSDITGANGTFTIGFNKSLIDLVDSFPPNDLDSNISTWSFESGDRIRLVSNDVDLPGWDFEIVDADESVGTFKVVGEEALTIDNDAWYWFEVYRPQRGILEGDDIFFTIGKEYRIENPGQDNRYHNVVPLPTNSVGSPSQKTGLIDFGDVYRRLQFAIRGDSTVFSFFESNYLNLVNENQIISYSRPIAGAIESPNRRFQTMLIHGGRLFEGTEINDLLRFQGGEIFLNERDGAINRIMILGYVLKAIQDLKVTSIYIGRVIVQAGDGQTREGLSDNTFGYVNPYDEQAGCIDPGSVVRNVRHMYFFDRINGQFYRDAPNGLFPISQYKAVSYFDSLAKNWGDRQMFCEFNENLSELNATTYSEVFVQTQGIFDDDEVQFGIWQAFIPNTDAAKIPIGATVLFTDQSTFSVNTVVTGKVVVGATTLIGLQIPIPNPVPSLEDGTQVLIEYRQTGLGETITFFEDDNRWKTFMPYVPYAYGRFGRVMVSFLNGQLYLHESNSAANTFYGSFTPSKISLQSNIHPHKIKVFDNISLYADKVWSSPDDGDILIPATALHPSGMSSRLKAGKFVKKEGLFHAEFLRDLNTPGAISNKILTGRRLRGEVLLITLTNTDNFLVTLSKLIVYSQPSEISG